MRPANQFGEQMDIEKRNKQNRSSTQLVVTVSGERIGGMIGRIGSVSSGRGEGLVGLRVRVGVVDLRIRGRRSLTGVRVAGGESGGGVRGVLGAGIAVLVTV